MTGMLVYEYTGGAVYGSCMFGVLLDVLFQFVLRLDLILNSVAARETCLL